MASPDTIDPLQLGQHFLKDESIIESLVAAASLGKDDVVLEPGFGQGSITRHLAAACKVIAVEIDLTLILDIPGVEVVHANALDLIKSRAFTAIVANPPFSMLEPLIKRVFPVRACSRLVLVMPQTFADLLEGDKKLGVLARSVYALARIIEVPRTAFYPPPDTKTLVLRLERRPDEGKSPLERVLCELACQQDKKVKNALERFYEGTFTKRQVREKLAPLGDIAGKGVMALSEDQFSSLRDALEKF